jgi:hypothetical protein
MISGRFPVPVFWHLLNVSSRESEQFLLGEVGLQLREVCPASIKARQNRPFVLIGVTALDCLGKPANLRF